MRILTLCISVSFLWASAAAQAGEVTKQPPKKEQKKGEEQEKQEPTKDDEADKAREAEFKAKGLVEVRGVWVEKKHEADAKKGIFHHGGEVVNRFEKRRFQTGHVRHPITGRFIAAADLAKAKAMFATRDGEWVIKAEADKYHSNSRRPWIVRTINCNIVSTLPLDTILYKLSGQVDAAYRKLQPIFGGATHKPNRRPIVVVLPTTSAYTAFGDDYGGGGSSHGAFLTENFTMNVDGSRLRVGAALWDKNWGPYYVRHATGVATSHAYCDEATDNVPQWFHRAVGGFVERHYSGSEAKFFATQHVQKGGIEDVAKWLSKFEISGNLPRSGKGDIGYNIFQAGLLLSFSMRGGNKDATDALQKVSTAFVKGENLVVAVKELGEVLGGCEEDLKTYLEKVAK